MDENDTTGATDAPPPTDPVPGGWASDQPVGQAGGGYASVPPVVPGELADPVRREGELARAVVLGLLAAVVGAAVWAAVSAATGYELGIAAVGVGLLVGYVVHRFGGGRPRRGVVVASGVLGAFGAVLGLFGEVGLSIAKAFDVGLWDVLTLTDWGAVAGDIFSDPFTWLWVAIAAYAAVRVAASSKG